MSTAIQTLNKVVELAHKRRDEALAKLAQLRREMAQAQDQMQQLQTYADEAQAGQAATALGNTAGFAKLLTLVGLQFRDFKAVAEKSDVQVTISVDDQSLRTLAKGLPQWLGQQ